MFDQISQCNERLLPKNYGISYDMVDCAEETIFGAAIACRGTTKYYLCKVKAKILND